MRPPESKLKEPGTMILFMDGTIEEYPSSQVNIYSAPHGLELTWKDDTGHTTFPWHRIKSVETITVRRR